MSKRKNNDIAIKIAAVAVTIAIVACIYILIRESSEISWQRSYKKSERNATEYIEVINDLMAKRDYLAIAEYQKEKNIRFDYKSDYYQYMNVFYATESFENIYEYLLEHKFKDVSLADANNYKIKSLSYDVYNLYKYVKDENIEKETESEEVANYLRSLRKDTGYFLKTYLYLSDEQIASIETESEAIIYTIIEEAYLDAWEE